MNFAPKRKTSTSMSKSAKKVSDAALEERGTASVFDFLYNDGRRVGSLLAQMDDNGLLTEIRHGEKVTRDAVRGGSISGSVFGTGGGIQVTPKAGGEESSERVYDPFWSNARELLDALDDNDLIMRDLKNAGLGSIILLSGEMRITDLTLLRSLWGLQSVRKLMRTGLERNGVIDRSESRQARRAKGRQKTDTEVPLPPEQEMLLEMLPVLPHSLTVTVGGNTYSGWGNLREEFLVATGADIVMKHGETIPGEWSMLGVLDAQPDEGGQGDVDANNLVDFTDASRLIDHSLVGQFGSIMSPIFRILLGRPGTHYGVTPLLIFREISPNR